MRKLSLKKKDKKNGVANKKSEKNTYGISSEENQNGENDPLDAETSKGKRKQPKRSAAADEEQEFEVEEIINHKMVRGKLTYLIRWKGFGAQDDTWERSDTLSCPKIVDKYQEENNLKDSSKGKTTKSPIKETTSATKNKKQKTDEIVDNESDTEQEYEVDHIIDVHNKRNGNREFLIRWKGFGASQDSWEPENNVNCPELVTKFMDKIKTVREDSTNTKKLGTRSSKRNNGRQK